MDEKRTDNVTLNSDDVLALLEAERRQWAGGAYEANQVIRSFKERIQALIDASLDTTAERTIQEDFIESFDGLQTLAHETAVSKGFWDQPREDGTLLCLMHSEISEALEAFRHGNPPDDKIPEFTGIEAELADVIIRIMDYAAYNNYRVAQAVVAKMAYNPTRRYKHGKAC